MNSAQHLLPEDHPEYARVLDEALRGMTGSSAATAGGTGGRPGTEQLRALALEAAPRIAARAAGEYRAYVTLREKVREGARQQSGVDTPEGGNGGGAALTTAVGETAGAGLLAVFTVLAPVLAGAAAAIFLLIGYLLHLFSPDAPTAGPIINAGWVFLALAAAATVIAMCGLVFTALRNGSGSLGTAGRARGRDRDDELARLRETWRRALLDRGILPFLREAQRESTAALAAREGGRAEDASAEGSPEEDRSGGRTPQLGYNRPGFSSPGGGDTPGEGGSRPRFNSPGFSSPGYGGPDHPPE
ncbi:hypothetical protein [Streptomyces zingiberis]|nr:hypothetical protein [Streptomyces zingiberis]